MTYGDYYTSYMGYKTSQSDKSQEYSTDYTWYDFFANSAVSTIKETKALLKDADATDSHMTMKMQIMMSL